MEGLRRLQGYESKKEEEYKNFSVKIVNELTDIQKILVRCDSEIAFRIC